MATEQGLWSENKPKLRWSVGGGGDAGPSVYGGGSSETVAGGGDAVGSKLEFCTKFGS